MSQHRVPIRHKFKSREAWATSHSAVLNNNSNKEIDT
jgi:hypothetical protein